MHLTGKHSLSAAPPDVWDALHDVRLLRASVPGCEELEQTGPAEYTGAARIGIAVVKGLYRGSVTLKEEDPNSALCVAVDARSSHGRISGEGELTLEPEGEGTLIRYSGDVHVHGLLASVGQRLLPSASKTLTDQFFHNLERALGGARESGKGG